MGIDNYVLWTKKNWRDVVCEYLQGVVKKSPDEPSMAIFMAGLPGSGKTELSRRLLDQFNTKFVRIDMDELASKIEGYTPEKADDFRLAATILLN